MYLLNDSVYYEIKNLALGKSPVSPMESEFVDWFTKKFSIDILTIYCIKNPNKTGYVLYMIMRDPDDYWSMRKSPFKSLDDTLITTEFRNLALRYKFATKSMMESLVVDYINFSEEAKTEALWRAFEEIKTQVLSKCPSVWDVIPMHTQLVIFYGTDEDITVNENNGVSLILASECYSVLKKSDELNYYTRENFGIKFDSKENLDKNFEGNLFYYTR